MEDLKKLPQDLQTQENVDRLKKLHLQQGSAGNELTFFGVQLKERWCWGRSVVRRGCRLANICVLITDEPARRTSAASKRSYTEMLGTPPTLSKLGEPGDKHQKKRTSNNRPEKASSTEQAVSETSITSESTQQFTSQLSKDTDNSLPADFFDASKNDPAPATVDESEWQLFQKLITKETEVSNEIADADEEELQRDRDEMQEREHDMCLSRLEKLKQAAKMVKEKREGQMVVERGT
ncbi:3156_t:CDS:2, partial [Paraglomus occultum]